MKLPASDHLASKDTGSAFGGSAAKESVPAVGLAAACLCRASQGCKGQIHVRGPELLLLLAKKRLRAVFGRAVLQGSQCYAVREVRTQHAATNDDAIVGAAAAVLAFVAEAGHERPRRP